MEPTKLGLPNSDEGLLYPKPGGQVLWVIVKQFSETENFGRKLPAGHGSKTQQSPPLLFPLEEDVLQGVEVFAEIETLPQPRALHATVVALYEYVLAFAIPWITSVLLVLLKAYSCFHAPFVQVAAPEIVPVKLFIERSGTLVPLMPPV